MINIEIVRVIRGEGYLVQKTQAGTSFPFGPLTMPGGQSASLVTPGGVLRGDSAFISCSGDNERRVGVLDIGSRPGESTLSFVILGGGERGVGSLGTDLRMLSMENGNMDFGFVSLFCCKLGGIRGGMGSWGNL